jgi:hypothetical protein
MILLANSHQLIYFRPVESDDYLSVDEDHWYAELAGLGDELLLFFDITGDIHFFVLPALGFEIFLGHVAEVASRRAVDGDFTHTSSISYRSSMQGT